MSRFIAFTVVLPLALFSFGCTALDEDDGEIIHTRSYRNEPVACEAAAAPVDRAVGAKNRLFAAEAGRQMAYTVSLTLQVEQIEAADTELRELLKRHQGYIKNQRNRNYQLKIPLAAAETALAELRKLGTEQDFSFTGEDLTEVLTDLGVRLDNLRSLQTRLTELLKQAENVEDTLKIEKELSRITTELENLTARQKLNRNRVDYVEINLVLTQTVAPQKPVGQPEALLCYPWLQNLLSSNGSTQPWKEFKLPIPPQFAAIPNLEYPDSDCRCATLISADDCLLKLSCRDLPEGSDLDFWTELISRALNEFNSYSKVLSLAASFPFSS